MHASTGHIYDLVFCLLGDATLEGAQNVLARNWLALQGRTVMHQQLILLVFDTF